MSSRFIDEVRVRVKAGDGGRGCVAFRREKYVPRGGPSGGDGGDGGSVIFKVDPGLNTLYEFKHRPFLRAQNGRPGMGDNRAGRKGDDLIVMVPPGTVVRDAMTGEIIADLTQPGEEVVVARGGKGGRGNSHFATPVDRAPRKYEEGKPGEEKVLDLELRSMADVGLVGLPNAGKSTLLRAISNAEPEVGPYPFTTLTPHLGVVEFEGKRFVVADIPGLIEGASQGKGLGHEFLRHIKRTSVLLYVVDAKDPVKDPVQAFREVRAEVLAYSPDMGHKKYIVAVNKIDLIESDQELAAIRQRMEEEAGAPVYLISAERKIGIQDMIVGLAKVVSESGS